MEKNSLTCMYDYYSSTSFNIHIYRSIHSWIHNCNNSACAFFIHSHITTVCLFTCCDKFHTWQHTCIHHREKILHTHTHTHTQVAHCMQSYIYMQVGHGSGIQIDPSPFIYSFLSSFLLHNCNVLYPVS